MKYPVIIFMIILTMITGMPAKAQQAKIGQTIRGEIVDKVTGSPLPGATVVIAGTQPLKGTTTDSEGNFRLENVPVGRTSLQISFMGYKTAFLNNLLVTSGKEVVLRVELDENIITTNEVVITAKADKAAPLNKLATNSARSFTVEETNRYAGSLGDPSRMASNFAGVYAADDSRNDIIIRGNSPLGLLWRMDGMRIPNPNHFGAVGTTGGPVSMINNNLLANSDFFTGAFPAEYGNASSGVFDLRMRRGNDEKYEFTGQIGFNGFEADIEGPLNKKKNASFLASYRYSTLEIFDRLGIKLSPGSSIPEYQDLTFKGDWQTKKLGKFSIFGIGGLSNIKLYDSQKAEDEFSYGLSGTDTDFGAKSGVIGLSNTYFFDSDSRLKTNVSISYIESTTSLDSLISMQPLEKQPFYRSDNRQTTYSFSTHYSHRINARNNYSAGIIFDNSAVLFQDSAYDSKDARFEVLSNANGNVGIMESYVEWQHHFSDALELNGGLHYQLFTLNNSMSIEPRVGISWDFQPSQTLSLAYGLHSQTQPFMTYFVVTTLPGSRIVQTNKDMGFTLSHQVVAGYDRNITEHLRIKLEAYYQYLFDVPVKESFPEYSMLNQGAYFNIQLTDSLVNRGKGYNYGVELTLERFLDEGYYFLITTSFFESKYRGYDGILRNTAFNSNFVVNALGGYEIKIGQQNRLALDLRGIYAGGRRYTPVDIAESQQESRTEYDWIQAYAFQYDPYFSLDVRLSFKMNLKNVDQEWAVEIKNVTNHQNIFQQTYDPVENRIRVDYQQGIFPVMLYRIRF